MKKTIRILAATSAALALPLFAFANHHETMAPLSSTVAIKSLESAAGKIADLTAAFPAAKLDWSPSEGVRGVRGVIAYVAGATTSSAA